MLPTASLKHNMSTYDLSLALIVLTCLILVLVLVYFLYYCIKRAQQKRKNLSTQDLHHVHRTHTHKNVGHDLSLPLYTPKVEIERSDIENPYGDRAGDGLQRLSRLTTVAPSIDLLPQIRTSGSSERAEDWLERRERGDVDGNEIGNGKVVTKNGIKTG